MKRVQLFFLPKELNTQNYGWSTYPNVTPRNKASGNFEIWAFGGGVEVIAHWNQPKQKAEVSEVLLVLGMLYGSVQY